LVHVDGFATLHDHVVLLCYFKRFL
jgi:hypothetical protein